MKFLIFLTSILGFTTFASNAIQCKTPRENIVFKLKDNNLSLDGHGRFPAQLIIQRTKIDGNKVDKVFYISGDKHTIHIDNIGSFNDFNDYISIKSQKGHEITYSLNCKTI